VTATAAPPRPAGLDVREARLLERLRQLPSILVAYSGGVDSAYLAWAAHRALGFRALAVTGDSPSYPERHRAMAVSIARDFGLSHEIIHTHEIDRPAYRANGPDRCYHCKHELYGALTALAASRGIAAVADGTNADDRSDVRPGRTAAREFGVISPLDEADLSKDDIRALSRDAGLPCWDEPASACLSSRVPFYSEVTVGKLRTIEAAETAVRALGFRMARVRHHGELARIELSHADVARAAEPAMARALVDAVGAAGFRFVTLDLGGYRPAGLRS
jgi:uncharacterized protein